MKKKIMLAFIAIAVSLNVSAQLNFHINKAIINTKLGNNQAELDKMRKTIDLVKNDADVHINFNFNRTCVNFV